MGVFLAQLHRCIKIVIFQLNEYLFVIFVITLKQ